MPSFTKAELQAALEHYTSVVEGCSASGDWAPFGDLFTEDVHYTEHAYGHEPGCRPWDRPARMSARPWTPGLWPIRITFRASSGVSLSTAISSPGDAL